MAAEPSEQSGAADAASLAFAHRLDRRELLQGAAVLGASLALGCSGKVDTTGIAGADGDSDAGNRAPVWRTIPDQTWVVGVPVNFDLAPYCTDPDGDALIYGLDLPLPAGLTLAGSVITGTPLAQATAQPYVASADDRR